MLNNKKPTIYFSTYDDIKNPHYGGGGAMAIHEVAKRLTKQYTIRVISWNYSGKKEEMIEGVQYERFGYPFLSPKVAMFAYQIALPFVALRKEFDIWMESFCPPFTTAFLPLFIKKPIVGIVHMLAAEDMERKYKLPFHLIENSGIKLYKNLLVTSEALKRKIEEIHAVQSIIVISNGIDKVHKPIEKKQKYILFLGRIEVNQKGIDLLLVAFKEFAKKHTDYQLIIAGSGDKKEIEHMKEIIKKNELLKQVILKGKVSGESKESLLKNAACVVISSRFETYSLVALEAMAHGTPIVSFSIRGLSWIPQKIVKKVVPYNTVALSNALSTIVTNTALVSSMIKEGNMYAKNFTWDAIAQKYDEYLKQLTK
ncbi:MAG TPA: glycosyltransferase family 4 protein [Candidatus Saccharimonadales bacterium]|nr:glycosyltransferase family 4 protein [Candidatus Saccharimonadales bacterium]